MSNEVLAMPLKLMSNPLELQEPWIETPHMAWCYLFCCILHCIFNLTKKESIYAMQWGDSVVIWQATKKLDWLVVLGQSRGQHILQQPPQAMPIRHNHCEKMQPGLLLTKGPHRGSLQIIRWSTAAKTACDYDISKTLQNAKLHFREFSSAGTIWWKLVLSSPSGLNQQRNQRLFHRLSGHNALGGGSTWQETEEARNTCLGNWNFF